jgi:hypothetical protein
VCEKLRSNADTGLKPVDFHLREEFFGSNLKKPPVITPFFKLFLNALDDFMLKFLSVCGICHLGIELSFAEGAERNTGK